MKVDIGNRYDYRWGISREITVARPQGTVVILSLNADLKTLRRSFPNPTRIGLLPVARRKCQLSAGTLLSVQLQAPAEAWPPISVCVSASEGAG